MNTASPLTLWRQADLATMDGTTPYGWRPDGALLTEGGTLRWVGALGALPAGLRARIGAEVDLGGRLVTPGLIDAHTHLVYAGDRAREFEQRLQGASYEQIARAGGGIRSTVAATRAASEATLLGLAKGRARQLLVEGVTTLEIKSGYGLDADTEARCLRVARRVGAELGLTVRCTSLGAHALPPEYDGRPDDYIDAVAAWLPAQAADGLVDAVDAVDAFCDTIGFTPVQTRRVFDAARALGLPVKLHAEQLSNQEGAALAAGYGALSCDHIEHLSAAGLAAMARAGTVAMLLPTAFYFLRDTQLPPVAALRQAGVPMAVASDHNPGSSPGLSLLLAMNMACTLFRLTPEEALAGTTLHAARALGLQATHGRLAPGCRADFVAWNLNHPAELSYWFGQRPAQRVVAAGRTLHLAAEALPMPDAPDAPDAGPAARPQNQA